MSTSSSSSNRGTVLITGGNTGCGYASSLRLAQLGYHVIIACRNMDKAEAAIKRMKESRSHNDLNVEAMKMDTSDLESIEQLVQLINNKHYNIDILICNAGINADITPINGLCAKFLTNYLGHYHLIRLLLPNLHRTSALLGKPSRIINVSSCMHRFGSFKFDQFATDTTMTGRRNYSTSKLAQAVLSCELQRKFAQQQNIDYSTPDSVIRTAQNTGSNQTKETSSLVNNPNPNNSSGTSNLTGGSSVVSITINPGAVDSDIWNSYSKFSLLFMRPIFSVLFLTPSDGSLTTVHAATLNPPPTSPTDYHYYSPYGAIGTSLPLIGKSLETAGDCWNYPLWAKARRVEMATGVEDEKVAKELWELSERLVKERRGEDVYNKVW